jgi:predicted PurR-regulated permease PerM
MGLRLSARGEKSLVMQDTARRAAIATLVVGSIVVAALALWKLRVVLALVFLAITIAAAMRPGVDALQRRRVPRPVGLLIHYAGLAALFALFIWIVVPRALHQVQTAIGSLPESAQNSSGVKHDLLVGLERRLSHVPQGSSIIHPALTITTTAFEILIGIFFTFACAAYWLFERDRCVDLVASLVPRPKRKRVRDTWDLIDMKLGAYVRGQGVLIVLVAAALSAAFFAIGLPYWILVGSFAGLVEIVPVIGPLTAGALAVGVGLTESVRLAVEAGLCVLGVRLLEDYLIVPRVLGEATGLSPLVVLISVTATGILFGGFAVVLAIPIAAVCVTLINVVVRDQDPAEEEVPTVLFPAKDVEL